MELDRSGTYRFHGWTELLSRAPKRSWDAKNRKVLLEVNRVTNGANTFKYRLSLSLEEVAQLVDLVATTAITESREDVANTFAGSLRSLTRLSAVASGLVIAEPAPVSAKKG